LVIAFLFSFYAAAQNVIEGKITDSGSKNAVESAIVSLLDKDDVIAYQITDRNGHYRIAYSSWTDSLQLEIRLLGYKTAVFPVKSRNTRVDAALQIEAVNLKEFNVRAPAIYGKEDTIVYVVGAFSAENYRLGIVELAEIYEKDERAILGCFIIYQIFVVAGNSCYILRFFELFRYFARPFEIAVFHKKRYKFYITDSQFLYPIRFRYCTCFGRSKFRS